ncbi:DUF3310 domain-containing protein [Alkalicoccus luteus]|uniref:DUF3310 domain-containing protein n=1 Tax=Alkalicoccus luteus TaxID=1237094 RepID=A0A969PSK6_9BACI|nr:DUF3310 domain-containing protein [Alkalicoccus luteus]NJP37173.1 DUF3310 domain-containing protein [Alkalicoccus luteus]
MFQYEGIINHRKLKSAGISSEVTTYTLSEEELAKYRGAGHMELTKEEYMKLRESGLKEKECAEKLDVSPARLSHMKNNKWGLRDWLPGVKKEKPIEAEQEIDGIEQKEPVPAQKPNEIEQKSNEMDQKAEKQDIEKLQAENEKLQQSKDYYFRHYEGALKSKGETEQRYHELRDSYDSLERAHDELKRKTNNAEPEESFDDIRPAHYHENGIDPFTFFRGNFAPVELSGYHRGSAIKYISRAGKKGDPLTDLRKAGAHLQEWISAIEGEDSGAQV